MIAVATVGSTFSSEDTTRLYDHFGLCVTPIDFSGISFLRQENPTSINNQIFAIELNLSRESSLRGVVSG